MVEKRTRSNAMTKLNRTSPTAIFLVLICLILGGCAAASAQTFYAIYTPEPEAVLANLRITDFGVWSIRVKNNGTTQPNITTTDILGTPEASTVHWVESSLCLSMLTAA